MNNFMRVVWLICKREICPAKDGSARSQILNHMLVYFLPILGAWFLLVTVSLSGLGLIAAERYVQERIQQVRSSPYTSLFGHGGIYRMEMSDDNYSIYRWAALTIDRLFPQFDQQFASIPLFGTVKPCSFPYLDIRKRDGQHLTYARGLAVWFESASTSARPDASDWAAFSDRELVQEIKNRLVYNSCQAADFHDCIIVSLDTLEELGYPRCEHAPDFLYVNFSTKDEKKRIRQGVPLRVAVVDDMPYTFFFVISMDQWFRLKSPYYMDTITGFDTAFQGDPALLTEDIQDALPVEQVRSVGADRFRISLTSPATRSEVLSSLERKNLLSRMEVNSDDFDAEQHVKSCDGIILRLNFNLPEDFTWNKKHIRAIQRRLAREGVEIEGEVTELLGVVLNMQDNLNRLHTLFRIGLFPVFFILVCFLSVLLHTRILHIGIFKLLGYSDLAICFSFGLMIGLITIASFIPALTIISALLSLCSVTSHPLAYLNKEGLIFFSQVFCLTQIGIFLPEMYYVGYLSPAETISSRS